MPITAAVNLFIGRILPLGLIFLALSSAGAWQGPFSLPLDGDWKPVNMTGKTEGSSFEIVAGSKPALKISYVFGNTDPNSAEHPDEKGADRYRLALAGKWDLSDFSWGEITLTGDGSHFVSAVILTDSSGKMVLYNKFPLVARDSRTYGFTLAAPGAIDPGFDPSNVTEIALVAHEAGEGRYVVNQGSFVVENLTFSNQDRENQIKANLSYAAEVGKNDPELQKEIKAAEQQLAERKGSLADLEVASASFKHRALFPASSSPTPFVICSQSPLDKVRAEFLHFMGRPTESISLEAAANEYENAKVVVVPQDAGVKGISATVLDDLVGPEGGRIERTNIEVRRAGFVKTTPAVYTFVDYIGEVEDPLMPNGLMDVPGGRVQPVWFTVRVPEGTKPGVYTSRVRFSGAGHMREIPLSLRVYDYTLPKTNSVARHFYYWLPAVANWYGFRTGTQSCDYHMDGHGVPLEMIKDHLDFLLKYRVEIVNITWPFNSTDGTPNWPLKVRPDGSLDFSLHDELLEFCRERGMRDFAVGDFGRSTTRIADPTYRKNVEQVMKPYIAHLKEKGWLADGYFKVYDEPDTKEGWDALVEEAKFVRALSPDIKTIAAVAQPESRTKGLVDVFLFRPNNWSFEMAASIRKDGAIASWYWCATPYFKPYANYFLNYPGTDSRIIEWMHFKYDCPIFLHWAINNWNGNFKPIGEARWPDIPWNPETFATFQGEGGFTYPWPDGRLVASIRLEFLRDGAEDIESFNLLKAAAADLERSGKHPELVAEAKKLLSLDSVVQSHISYDGNSRTIEAVRRQASVLLERLRQQDR